MGQAHVGKSTAGVWAGMPGRRVGGQMERHVRKCACQVCVRAGKLRQVGRQACANGLRILHTNTSHSETPVTERLVRYPDTT